jgi:hypothetical protein
MRDGASSIAKDAKMSRDMADKRENVINSQPRITTKNSVQATSKQREVERSAQDALEDDEVREALKSLHARDSSD